jgi:hypothetical protein
LYAAGANADEPKGKPKESGASTGEHLERAGRELDAAGRKAADDAERAAAEAKQKAREAAKDTRERMQEAAASARKAADEAKEATKKAASDAQDGARETAERTGEAARELYEQGKERTRDALDQAREGTRKLLLQAADALSPEGRARARAERNQRWAELRSKLPGQPDDPEKVSPPMRAELAQHARRVARLERVRAVALDSHDDAAAANAAQLLDKENARHEQRMKQLTSEEKP